MITRIKDLRIVGLNASVEGKYVELQTLRGWFKVLYVSRISTVDRQVFLMLQNSNGIVHEHYFDIDEGGFLSITDEMPDEFKVF